MGLSLESEALEEAVTLLAMSVMGTQSRNFFPLKGFLISPLLEIQMKEPHVGVACLPSLS